MELAQPGSGTPGSVGQLYRFINEIEVGDYVLTPERATSQIHISRCIGDYGFDTAFFGEVYAHVRRVEYLQAVPRKPTFPQTVLNTLGSTLTVFRADNALPYIEALLGISAEAPAAGDEVETDLILWAEDVEGQARGQILEALDNIDHYDFQIFVAGVLNALGYKTVVGQKGRDGGVDVLAHPDQFGLASPRIKVQVKNQQGKAGHVDVGYLHGVLSEGETGLFVCTGGFSRDAEAASFVRSGRVALLDDKQLLDLVIERYEDLPASAKQLLPLRRLYVLERPIGAALGQ